MAAGKGHASAKHGRNKAKCKAYEGRKTRERNKITKIEKHLKRTGDSDLVAKSAIKRTQKALYV